MAKARGWSSWSTGIKVLVVILSVFGLAALVGLAGVIYGLYWVFGAGDQKPTAAVVTPQSWAVVRLDAEEPDPGVVKLITHLYLALQKRAERGDKNMPSWVQQLQDANNARQVGQLSMVIPREFTLSYEGPEDNPWITIATNFRGMSGLVKFVFNIIAQEEEITRREYRGHAVVVGDAQEFALVESTFVFTSTLGAMDPAIDRLENTGDKVELPEPFLSEGQSLASAGADLWVVARAGALSLGPESLSGWEYWGMGIDIQDEDAAKVQIRWILAPDTEAEEFRARLGVWSEALRRTLAENGLLCQVSVHPRESSVELQITGISAAVLSYIDRNSAE